MAVPDADFDDLDDHALLDLMARLKEGWATRNETIARAQELRTQQWQVAVPRAWKQTARTQHTSLATEIPARVTGTVTMREPTYARVSDTEFEDGEAANRVEQFHEAFFRYTRANALVGKDAYTFLADQLVNKGAACAASIYAPNAWASSVPLYEMDGATPRRVYWRDSSGKETDSERYLDIEATSRAHQRAVERHRVRAGVPITRRIVPTEQCYPLMAEGALAALLIERQASLIELGSAGFAVDVGDQQDRLGRRRTLREFITPNRCRYFLDHEPIAHERGDGEHGLYTGYGFVPYTYRVGLESGSLEWGDYGKPLLSLIDSNLRTITILRTYLLNAIYLASFTTFQLKYTSPTTGSVVDTRSGKTLNTFTFQSGMIHDFGPDREVVPFLHPGLNQDFYKLLAAEREEVDRIVPRTLVGFAESSGFNTITSSAQARTIFNPIVTGLKHVTRDLAIMDMRHLNDRVPGRVYLEREVPMDEGSRQKPQYERISISARDIDDYYQIAVDIDNNLDEITRGQWAANLLAAGIGDKQWASEQAGIRDYEGMVKRQARDRVLQSPQMMAVLEQEAMRVYGLEEAQEQAAATGRIQFGPDGTPLVSQPGDGRLAGPGQSQTPAQQAFRGAAGGLNPDSMPGAPNMDSTHNPTIQTPTRQQPVASQRRGGRPGRIPGAPQRQPFRPPRQPVGV